MIKKTAARIGLGRIQRKIMSTVVVILSFRCWWHLSSREWLEKGETAAAVKSLQSCPTLCNPIDGSPPGSPVPGILQGRTLEWVAISFSNAGKWKVKVKSLSQVRLFATPWTAAYQAPPSMGFSRQEYWSGVPLPSPIIDPKEHYKISKNSEPIRYIYNSLNRVWLFATPWTVAC